MAPLPHRGSRWFAAGALALGLATAAHAQSTPAAGSTAMKGDGPTADFVSRAGQSDKFEITESQIAARRTRNPRVRRFAAMMISAHAKTTAGLKLAIRQAQMPPPSPPTLRPEQQQMVDALRAAKGPAFDKAYIDQQVQAHQDTLRLMQGYAQNGAVPPLRTAAQKTTPIVQSHLTMAQSLQSAMR